MFRTTRGQFIQAANATYAELRQDAAAGAEVEAERTIWDATLLDGLASGETVEGQDLPPRFGN